MAIIKPFKAIRPHPSLADKVAALPYDVMNTEEAKAMVEGNPYSFLHIDRAEINFEEEIDVHSPRVYEKAKTVLKKMIDDQSLIEDQQDTLYIYRQIMDGRVQTGLMCCTSIDDYANNIIKKHEFTRPDKEQDRIDHVATTNTHTGPIFQTYRSNPEIEKTINQWALDHQPVYNFDFDGVTQQVWTIDDSETITKLVDLFSSVEYLYIADGHHRSAAAYRVGLQKRKANPDYDGTEEFNYFMAVLFPSHELKIMAYNRVVKDLAGRTEQEFIAEVEKNFTVGAAPSTPYEPEQKQTFGMYLGDQWYKLTPHNNLIVNVDPIKSLDVAILQDNLLDPILNIKNPRTDNRIEFIGGIRGLAELERRVANDMQVAFSLYPTAITEVMDVADANLVMPPKSTWFEPKLLSGLFLHRLS